MPDTEVFDVETINRLVAELKKTRPPSSGGVTRQVFIEGPRGPLPAIEVDGKIVLIGLYHG